MLEGIDRLEQTYRFILETQDAFFGVRVYQKLVDVYFRFYKMMENPPKIREASSKEVRLQLQDSVQQIKSKCLEYLELGLDLANNYKVNNEARAQLLRTKANLSSPFLVEFSLSETDVLQVFSSVPLSK